MKKINLLLLSCFLLVMSSCTKNATDNSATVQFVTSGTWRVTLFTDSGTDETASFTGYSFTFSGNGSLNLVNGSAIKTGTWSVGRSENKFVIDLGPKDISNTPYGEISKNWKILSSSSTQIKLGDDNAGSNEFLTFSKN